MAKKRAWQAQKIIFSKNEKIVKNYQHDDPEKTKISKKISDGRTDKYSDDNTPSGVNSAG